MRQFTWLIVAFAAASQSPRSAHAEPPPTWAIEASLGLFGSGESDYTSRLEQFGYDGEVPLEGHSDVSVAYRRNRYLELVLNHGTLSDRGFSRTDDSVTTKFSWRSRATTLFVRAKGPVGNPEKLVLFAEAGAGLATVTTEYAKSATASSEDSSAGLSWSLGVGFQGMVSRNFGIVTRYRRTWAPVLTNLYGEDHDVGGASIDLGVRVAF